MLTFLPAPYPYNLILLGLFSAWLLCLVGAFVLGKPSPDRTRHSVSQLLMASSAVLVMAAGVWWLAARAVWANISGWLALGMLAGLAGDLILAGYIPKLKGTLPGMVAFAFNHIAYLIALVGMAGLLNVAWGVLSGWVIGYLVVAVILWITLIYNPKTPPALRYGSMVYAGLIAVMTAVATGLAFVRPEMWWLALGANAFLLSDMVLGNQLFRQPNYPHVHDLIWVLYGTGQMMLVFSNAPLAKMLGG